MSISSGVVNVRTFGAAGTGSVSDSAAFQRALDFLSLKKYSRLEIPHGTYLIDSPVRMPGVSIDSGEPARFVVNGNGAKIKVSGAISAFDRNYASLGDYTSGVWNPIFKDLNFIGTGSSNAIRHWGNESMVLENCSFRDFSTCVHIGESENPSLSNCVFENVERGLVATELSGLATGATGSNSGVNMLTASGCVAEIHTVTSVGFDLIGCHMARIESCSVVGSRCLYGISVEEGTSPDVSARITDCSITPSTDILGSAINLFTDGAVIVIDNIAVPTYSHTAVDADGVRRSVIKVVNSHKLDFSLFGSGNLSNLWIFDGNILSTGSFSEDSKWINNGVPPLLEERTLNYG